MAKSDWITQFRVLYPRWDLVTDDILLIWMDVANSMLPNGFVRNCATTNYTTLQIILNFMVAHLLEYNQITDSSDGIISLTKNVSSMSADGLSLGYEGIAKLHEDMFASLNDFLNTTPYGRQVAVFLDKLCIGSGGFLV